MHPHRRAPILVARDGWFGGTRQLAHAARERVMRGKDLRRRGRRWLVGSSVEVLEGRCLLSTYTVSDLGTLGGESAGGACSGSMMRARWWDRRAGGRLCGRTG